MPAKRRRRSRQRHSALFKLKRRLQESGLSDNAEAMAIAQPGAGPKLSAALLEFVAPYRHTAKNAEAFGKLITLAIVAWNAAIMAGADGQKMVDTALAVIGKEAGEEARKVAAGLLAELMRRKLSHFAGDKRFIVDYQVTETRNAYHLAVVGVKRG